MAMEGLGGGMDGLIEVTLGITGVMVGEGMIGQMADGTRAIGIEIG